MSGNGTRDSWHESLDHQELPKGSSDQSFGLLFAALFGLIGLHALWKHEGSALWWIAAALLTCLIAQFAHPILGPLNRGWRRFSLLLFKIVGPVGMAVMFFGVITPAAFIMRRLGKDSLRMTLDPTARTYWIPREATQKQTEMMRQF